MLFLSAVLSASCQAPLGVFCCTVGGTERGRRGLCFSGCCCRVGAGRREGEVLLWGVSSCLLSQAAHCVELSTGSICMLSRATICVELLVVSN
jgi:hypothetical protein